MPSALPSALRPLRSMPTTTTAQARPMATPPSYHDLLTPRLHQRWVRVIALTAMVCYCVSVLTSDASNWFWTLFPLSWTGLKVVYFTLAMLPILALQVQYYHVDTIITPAPITTIAKCLGHIKTWAIFGAYSATSFFIMQYWLLSSRAESDLGLIIEGKSYERPRLNERYIYLSFLAVYLAFVQTGLHIWFDRSKLPLPTSSFRATTKIEPLSSSKLTRFMVDSRISEFIEKGAELGQSAGYASGVVSITGPFVYLFVRGRIWRFVHAIARASYPISRSNHLPSWPVYPGLLIRSIWISFLICICIEGCHAAFTLHFSLPPVRDAKPMSERSRDPNGTLLNGLTKEKKQFPRYMAFWELELIASYFDVRRKTIFTDIERKPQTWPQVKDACLAAIREVNTAITDLNKPPPAPSGTPMQEVKPAFSSSLPPTVVKSENIFLESPSSSRLQKYADKVIQENADVTLADRFVERVPVSVPKKSEVMDSFKEQIRPILTSRIGWLFKKTVDRKTATLIPDVNLQVHAVIALTRLVCASITDDDYGLVQRDLGEIFETIFTSIDVLQGYIENPPLDWTDIDAVANKTKLQLKEPTILLSTLNDGVREIAKTFSTYLDDIKMPYSAKRRLQKIARELSAKELKELNANV